MNGVTHRAITTDVVYMLTQKFHIADVAAEFAAFPDSVDDIGVEGVGPHLVGRDLCSLAHYTIPAGPRHYRGYNWKLDTSIRSIRGVPGVDLPDRPVYFQPDGWYPFVGVKHCDKHPLRLLLKSLKGKATLAADEFTYPTGAAMAEWLGKASSCSASVLGCILHYVQDAVVMHHAKGFLLNGHASWEGALQEAWHLSGDTNKDRWLMAASKSTRKLEPRRAVEEAARLTAYASVPVALVLARSVAFSGAVVRWWMGRK